MAQSKTSEKPTRFTATEKKGQIDRRIFLGGLGTLWGSRASQLFLNKFGTDVDPGTISGGKPQGFDPKTTLWYDRLGKDWLEALPLGNGRLGANTAVEQSPSVVGNMIEGNEIQELCVGIRLGENARDTCIESNRHYSCNSEFKEVERGGAL